MSINVTGSHRNFSVNRGARQDWRHCVRQLGQKGNTVEDPHISEGSGRALDRPSNSVVDDGTPKEIANECGMLLDDVECPVLDPIAIRPLDGLGAPTRPAPSCAPSRPFAGPSTRALSPPGMRWNDPRFSCCGLIGHA